MLLCIPNKIKICEPGNQQKLKVSCALLDNDEQLVRIWINVLTELKLLAVNDVGEYVITNKGREYLQTYHPHW